MKVLITGGAGFIGSHAVDHFVDMGDEVTVVDKLTYAGRLENLSKSWGRFTFKQLDICDANAMNAVFLSGGFDVVVNFAAETHVDNSIADVTPFMRTNIEGATVLMGLASHYNVMFCQLSTDEVYGDAVDSRRGFTTSDALRPRNPYSVTKAAADMMLLARHNTYKQPYLIFRPSNNFGPRQHEEKMLPKLIKCLCSFDSKDTYPLYGDGQQIREWTYAPDTVKAIRNAIMSGERNRILNVSSGFSLENIETIEQVKSIMAAKERLTRPDAIQFVADRPGHDRRYWIESDVPADSFTSFRTALEETVEHFFQRFA